jgi:NAD(P)H-hydrate epimerase
MTEMAMPEPAMFTLAGGEPVPAVTAAQMREVDRAMTGDFGIELPQMMENAGRNLADLALRRHAPRTAMVLAGPGGNGGGGLVAARHLANRGITVTVVLGTDRLAAVPARQLDIVRRMGIPVLDDPPAADLIIDALLGYSLRGDPAGRFASLITWANTCPSPVLALDAPSGLDVTSGRQAVPCVRADATMTLALPKTGLAGQDVTGPLYLADISVPRLLLDRMGITAPVLFRSEPVVRLLDAAGRR